MYCECECDPSFSTYMSGVLVIVIRWCPVYLILSMDSEGSTSYGLRPLRLGVEVTGVSLGGQVDPHTVEQLRADVVQHKLLVFRVWYHSVFLIHQHFIKYKKYCLLWILHFVIHSSDNMCACTVVDIGIVTSSHFFLATNTYLFEKVQFFFFKTKISCLKILFSWLNFFMTQDSDMSK